MRIELEPADIMAIADAVIRRLTPMLAEIKAISAIPPNPQQIPASTPLISVKPRGDMLKRDELSVITGLSASTIARMESLGQFPARVQLSSKRVAWRRNEVEVWAERRQSA